MSQQQTSPMAGVLRVLFFLAVAVVAVTVVVSGVTTLYEAPSGDEGGFQELEGFGFEQDQESAMAGEVSIQKLLGVMKGLGASDLHLKAGMPP